MRCCAALLLLAAAVLAGPPKAPDAVPDAKMAVEIARTRGKLIFLTVIVDHDQENRAVIENVFRDPEFLKIAKEFVILYANPEDEHGRVRVKGKDGKRVERCADCPTIECGNHIHLAQHYSRAFFPSPQARTPIHFVINAKEEVVATIKNGDFETGFSHVPAGTVVGELRKLLRTHGKGLSEPEYEKMQRDLSDARAAKARGKITLELQHLLAVVAVDRDVEAVREAKTRIAQIDAFAAKQMAEKAAPLLEAKQWEEALDALGKIQETYPGTLTAETAKARIKELNDDPEVKRLLRAAEYYQQGMKFKERKKLELARKRFEKCVRLGEGTKYAELAQKELDALPE